MFRFAFCVPEEGLGHGYFFGHLKNSATPAHGLACSLGIVAPFESLAHGAQAPCSPARSVSLCSSSVPEEGLEPSHLAIHDFESCASAIPPLRQYGRVYCLMRFVTNRVDALRGMVYPTQVPGPIVQW